MEVDIIVAVGLAVVALFFIAQVSRVMRNRALHTTLRKSVESGQPLTPELVDNLDRAPEPGAADQRIGFVLIALGLAVIAGALISGSNDLRDLMAVSVFPLFVGAALLLRLRLAAKREVEP
ncbi:MAG: DUF6249 domain-containing protein [Paracoccaceae bacterium]